MGNLRIVLVFFLLVVSTLIGLAQEGLKELNAIVKPRMRVIIDNDLGGDPDGLFQLAHHVLSPSVEIRGIMLHIYTSKVLVLPVLLNLRRNKH